MLLRLLQLRLRLKRGAASRWPLVLLALSWSTLAHATPAPPEGKKVVAYFFARDAEATSTPPATPASPAALRGDLLTHINYAFATIHEGRVALGNPGLDLGSTTNTLPATPQSGNLAALRALKLRYPHLKTLISVGGWTWSGAFSKVAARAADREKFARSAVAFIRQHGFDGVDIDWEFPVAGGLPENSRSPHDKQNFTLLLRALRRHLDQAGRQDHTRYLLSAAFGNHPSFLQNTEIPKLAGLLDWANLMSYDFHGPWETQADHHAPLQGTGELSVRALVEATIQAGMPAHKLNLGLPFYGYAWEGCIVHAATLPQVCRGKSSRGSWEAGSYSFQAIAELLASPNQAGYVRYWDSNALAPFLHHPQRGETISYDDVESIRAKLSYLQARGLGGAMFWESGGDDAQARLQTTIAAQLLGK